MNNAQGFKGFVINRHPSKRTNSSKLTRPSSADHKRMKAHRTIEALEEEKAINALYDLNYY